MYNQPGVANAPEYPSATSKATVLYARKVLGKEGKITQYADHFSIIGSAMLRWQTNISEEGNYDIVLNYSAKKDGASVSLHSPEDSITDQITITSGVYNETKEWYQFNCVRKLLKGELHLAKGSNSIVLHTIPPDNDFETILYSVELIPVSERAEIIKETANARKIRPGMDWFSSSKYGVMFHWTSQSVPRSGPSKPYKEAVENFDVDAFVAMVAKTGADYVVFTGNHAEPHFPAPLQLWEKEYPGWTTKRDLIAEISDGLRMKNIRFILYLATHVYAKQGKVNTEEFERLNFELLSEIGERYKNKIDGYWLDGFYQSYQNHPDFDFKKFYQVSKIGNPNRLLALNSWLYPIVSEWQDYWAGEVYTPGTVPASQIIQAGPGKGLQFHSLVVLENDWVHSKVDTKIPSPRLETNSLVNYINACAGKGPVTINLGIYQGGTIGEEAFSVMQKIKQQVKPAF